MIHGTVFIWASRIWEHAAYWHIYFNFYYIGQSTGLIFALDTKLIFIALHFDFSDGFHSIQAHSTKDLCSMTVPQKCVSRATEPPTCQRTVWIAHYNIFWSWDVLCCWCPNSVVHLQQKLFGEKCDHCFKVSMGHPGYLGTNRRTFDKQYTSKRLSWISWPPPSKKNMVERH